MTSRNHLLNAKMNYEAVCSMARSAEELAECTRKKFFRLEKYAIKERDKGIRKGYLRSTARIYKCTKCVGYHITNGKTNYEY